MTYGGGVGGGRETQEGGDGCLHIADSLCCTAKTNTTLESNYTPKKEKKNSTYKNKQKAPQ